MLLLKTPASENGVRGKIGP